MGKAGDRPKAARKPRAAKPAVALSAADYNKIFDGAGLTYASSDLELLKADLKHQSHISNEARLCPVGGACCVAKGCAARGKHVKHKHVLSCKLDKARALQKSRKVLFKF